MELLQGTSQKHLTVGIAQVLHNQDGTYIIT